jgi:triosephosphate isomerase (TIM)
MARKKFIAGNWKMTTNSQSARTLAQGVVKGLGDESSVEVALCPPFPWLGIVAEEIKNSPLSLGAQNVYPVNEGAYTGEVSPTMLADAGVKYVIVGHSERRHGMGESDFILNRKVKAALAAGLNVIFCIGETLAERESNQTNSILEYQTTAGLVGVDHGSLSRLVIAYEPVWAIGTGRNATPEQAQEAHAFIRSVYGNLFNAEAAENLQIQYGGSVKPDNAAVILGQPDVDGALVGGASLKADSFLAIIRAGLGK